MITVLNKEWDEGIRDCFYHSGPGINNFVLSMPMRKVVEYMVNDCCDLIGQNKNVNIKAEFKMDVVNIEELAVYAIFCILNPEEEIKRQEKKLLRGRLLVKIKIPSFSRSFNEEPQEWYRETMKILWNGYKEYMEGKVNYF